MTKEQLEKLHVIGKEIQRICPDMYGSIRFNLKPGREAVSLNIEESKMLEDSNKHSKLFCKQGKERL